MTHKRILIGVAIVGYGIAAFILQRLLPDTQTLFAFVSHAYLIYGYGLVFLLSLCEGTFIIGMFVPGTAVIMYGAMLAGRGQLSLPLIILAGAGGLWGGSMLSYGLGRLGWQRMHLLKKVPTWHSQTRWLTFLSFASTGVGATIATAAGVMQLPLKQVSFLLVITHLFWVSVWAITAYFFGLLIGNSVLAFLGGIVLVVLGSWVLQWYVRGRKQA